MKSIEYTLPEWVFLDGYTHEGDLLKGRTVIQHVRSYTIIEAICLDDLTVFRFEGKQMAFTYESINPITRTKLVENHLLVVHFSLAEEHELDDILEKAKAWYISYMAWEDQNIALEGDAYDN